MADATVLGRPVWYELLTTDMKAAENFYAKVVGWTVQPFAGAGQPYEMWARPGDVTIGGVMKIPEGMNFPPHWEMYVAVPKIEDAIAKIERLGGTSLGPLIEVPDVGRMRTMTDPQGAVFAIIEPAPTENRPEAPPEIGDASWRELYSSDAPAAMKFYAEIFGWKPTRSMDMGPMGQYQIFGRAWDIGGMMNKPKEMAQMPSAWNIYFRVADADAAAERVKANGGQVLNGPMDVPDGDRVVNCMDPQGAAFGMHAKKG